jgi:ACT domain-containing protein
MNNDTEKNKELLIEQFKKTPIVETACQKIGIGRSTYYFWRKEDKAFAELADEALQAGSLLVNDLAESQLIAAIKEGNMSGIMFWLRNNHPTYKNRLDITAHLEKEEAMTPEQQEVVKRALELAHQGLMTPEEEKKISDALKLPPEKPPEAGAQPPQVEKPAENDQKQNNPPN